MSFRFTGNWLFLPTWLALFRRISGRAAWVKEEVHFLNRALSENPREGHCCCSFLRAHERASRTGRRQC